jgi:glycosyltransferase involved in cell wall biosynthesis
MGTNHQGLPTSSLTPKMNPKISICIPYHDTPNTAFYLARLLRSIEKQTFKDYELVIDKAGNFAKTHNKTIARAKGEIIQMLQMDDYLADKDSLERIYSNFFPSTTWLISASLHDQNGEVGGLHIPQWVDDIWTGNNKLGSVSTLAMRREKALLFEEPLSWLVDCDLYYRLYLKYGEPKLCKVPNVVIDTRTDRLTHTLSDQLKLDEIYYLRQKYGK